MKTLMNPLSATLAINEGACLAAEVWTGGWEFIDGQASPRFGKIGEEAASIPVLLFDNPVFEKMGEAITDGSVILVRAGETQSETFTRVSGAKLAVAAAQVGSGMPAEIPIPEITPTESIESLLLKEGLEQVYMKMKTGTWGLSKSDRLHEISIMNLVVSEAVASMRDGDKMMAVRAGEILGSMGGKISVSMGCIMLQKTGALLNDLKDSEEWKIMIKNAKKNGPSWWGQNLVKEVLNGRTPGWDNDSAKNRKGLSL